MRLQNATKHVPSASRIFFVAVPFLLTIGAIIGLMLAFLGNINLSSIAQRFWWLSIDLDGSSLPVEHNEGSFVIGLWNYCAGPAGREYLYHCSSPTAGYYFNPIKVIHLPDPTTLPTGISSQLDSVNAQIDSALGKLSTLSHWTAAAYIIALISAAITIPISILAFKRRLGSLLAAAFSAATCIFALAASACATTMFVALYTAVHEDLEDQYKITPVLNKSPLAATWIGTVMACGAFCFWMLTACCCKGRVAGREVAPRSARGDAYQEIGHQQQWPGRNDQKHGWGEERELQDRHGYHSGFGRGGEEEGDLGARKFEPYRGQH